MFDFKSSDRSSVVAAILETCLHAHTIKPLRDRVRLGYCDRGALGLWSELSHFAFQLVGAFASFRGSRISRTVATLTRAQDKFCCFLLRCFFFFFLLFVFCCFCPFYFFARANGDRRKEFCVRETLTLWSPMWVCWVINYRVDFVSFKANN